MGWNWELGLAVVIASMLAWATPSNGAVRDCQPQVSSGPMKASSEIEARALAMARWLEIAREYGEAYASWRLAATKCLTCLAADEGVFVCLAKARPCTLVHVAPDDWRPGRPLLSMDEACGPDPLGRGTRD